VSTDVSEEHIASIFRVEKINPAKKNSVQADGKLVSCWTYFFDPENGGEMFLRNVDWRSTDYTALYPRMCTLQYRDCCVYSQQKIQLCSITVYDRIMPMYITELISVAPQSLFNYSVCMQIGSVAFRFKQAFLKSDWFGSSYWICWPLGHSDDAKRRCNHSMTRTGTAVTFDFDSVQHRKSGFRLLVVKTFNA
jgi:hypothetical protein